MPVYTFDIHQHINSTWTVAKFTSVFCFKYHKIVYPYWTNGFVTVSNRVVCGYNTSFRSCFIHFLYNFSYISYTRTECVTYVIKIKFWPFLFYSRPISRTWFCLWRIFLCSQHRHIYLYRTVLQCFGFKGTGDRRLKIKCLATHRQLL